MLKTDSAEVPSRIEVKSGDLPTLGEDGWGGGGGGGHCMRVDIWRWRGGGGRCGRGCKIVQFPAF